MSSRYVRNTFRQWLTTIATPFHETVNVTSNPTEAIWCTVAFYPFDNERVTLCDIEEAGEIELNYFAQPGTGDDAVLQALEADVVTLLSKADVNGRFRLISASPPDDMGMPDANFRVSARFEYSYFH